MHSKKLLNRMIETCHQKGILTIGDEVMTGFGRTGSLFVCNTLQSVPDLICLSKGITGGFLPMGATVVKKFIFESFLSKDLYKAFLQGHSYTANSLACAAANASLDLLLTQECGNARKMIESEHRHFQKYWGEHPKLRRCDVMGTILAIEYNTEHSSYDHPMREHLMEFFKAEGVLVRPFGNLLYILPPYCITCKELQKIYSLIEITLEEWP